MLSEIQRELVMARYRNGETCSHIARVLGLTKEYVDSAVKPSSEKIQEVLQEGI